MQLNARDKGLVPFLVHSPSDARDKGLVPFLVHSPPDATATLHHHTGFIDVKRERERARGGGRGGGGGGGGNSSIHFFLNQ